jgi:hypothetical protein
VSGTVKLRCAFCPVAYDIIVGDIEHVSPLREKLEGRAYAEVRLAQHALARIHRDITGHDLIIGENEALAWW